MTSRTRATAVGVLVALALWVAGPPALPVYAGQRTPSGRQFGRLGTTRPITYFIAYGTGEAGYRHSDRELARWAFEAWERIAATRIRLQPATESDAMVRLYWAGSNGAQLGEMRPLTIEGRRGAAVYIRPNLEAFGETIGRRASADSLLRETIVYLTCLHELGHAFGLAHSRNFDDIMYSLRYGGDSLKYFGRYRAQLQARDDMLAAQWLSESDVRRFTALYRRR
jgi:hypothetical protein